MSMPTRCAARMKVSPGSKGISRSSSLKVGILDLALPIALAADHVERAEAGHDVGDHLPRDHALESARDVIARGPDAHAIGRPAAVAHDVEAELAVPAF